jgi:amino acid adenylation domain-containing protein/FkbH-like protein
MTPMQGGLYYHYLAAPHSNVHFQQGLYTIKGHLDNDLLEQAINVLIRRYDVLRTVFRHSRSGVPLQVVLEQRQMTLHVEDIAHLEEEQGKQYVQKALENDRARGFDLTKDLLLRAVLFRHRQDRYTLVFSFHHILMDAWCMTIILFDLFRVYNALKEERPVELEPVVPFSRFLEWLDRQDNDAGLDFWRRYLDGYDNGTRPGGLQATGGTGKYRGEEHICQLPPSLTRQLLQTAQSNQVTLNEVFQTLWGLVLQEHCGTPDIVFGSVVSGRPPEIEGVEQMVGLFINTVPVRLHTGDSDTFVQLLEQVHSHAVQSKQYEYIPLVDIQGQTGAKESLIRHLFIFQNLPQIRQLPDLNVKDMLGFEIIPEAFNDQTNYDFNLMIIPAEPFLLRFSYNAEVYTRETVRHMAERFTDMAEQVVKIPAGKIRQLRTISKNKPGTAAVRNRVQQVNLVVAATFTANPLAEYIAWWGRQFRLDIDVRFAPYNQVFQQLLDEQSLISNNTGINLLLIRFEDWIRESILNAGPAGVTEQVEEQLRNKLEEEFRRLETVFSAWKKNAPCLVGIFPVSNHLDLGQALTALIEKLNDRWAYIAGQADNCFPLDFRTTASLYGIDNSGIFDVLTDREGHVPFSDAFYAAAGTVTARHIRALRQPPFKVIALDLDNTLWRGIAGEDGPLGVTVEGPYLELQRFMEKKLNEGMLLVMVSKNNEADVRAVFEQNPGMHLKWEHFVTYRINWETKSENLKSVAEELNIGLDSFVFIDDSPAECAEVMLNAPAVLTLQLPAQARAMPAFLQHVWAFDRLIVTTEDRERTRMYQAEKERQKTEQESPSLTRFLQELELKVSMNPVQPEQVERAAQLTQRTNQFNLSTIRRSPEELADLVRFEDTEVWAIEVADRFGDYGFVGLVVSKEEGNCLLLDTLLLSCRVLGRNVEHSILAGLKKYCVSKGIDSLRADYYASPRNKPVLDFMRSCWQEESGQEEKISFRLEITDIDDSPAFVDFFYMDRFKEIPDKGDKGEKPKKAKRGDRPKIVRSSYSWEFDMGTVNGTQLQHSHHLLPLTYHTAEGLLQLPVHEGSDRPAPLPDIPYIAPGSEMERDLVGIWSEILHIDPSRIGIRTPFFQLGGHSLKAIGLIARIHHRFEARITLNDVFKYPTIEALARFIEQEAAREAYRHVEPVEEQTYYPLSSAQQRLYILQQLEPASSAYNIPQAAYLDMEADLERFEAAFNALISRHESLRTSFRLVDDVPVQIVHKPEEVAFEVRFNREGAADPDATVKAFVRPFDLSSAPLLRVDLSLLRQNSYLLMVDMHHIISDGTSCVLLMQEFAVLYEQGSKALGPLSIQYKDYACWQNRNKLLPAMKRQETYWLSVYSGEIPVLNLPYDFPRPRIQGFEGTTLSFQLGKQESTDLDRLAAEHGVTSYMLMLAVFNVLLAKLSGQEDIIVGTPTAGRNQVELENLIGVFVNTLALRNRPVGQKSFSCFLQGVKENTLNAFENQEYPFEDLIEAAAVQRDASRNPLYNVMMVMQNFTAAARHLPEINTQSFTLRPYPYDGVSSVADLALYINPADAGDGFYIVMEYSTHLFKRDTANRFVSLFKNTISAVIAHPGQSLARLDILPDSERSRILYEFNDTSGSFPKEQPLHRLFESAVEKGPGRTALAAAEIHLSYRELNTRSNRVALVLRQKGVSTDSIVGLMAGPPLDLLVGIMGILKAGAAYLPLDTRFPEERIDSMLKDCGTTILATTTADTLRYSSSLETILIDRCQDRLPGGPAQEQNLEPAPGSSSSNLAYVIFTSGSTGKPKGTLTQHYNVSRVVCDTDYIRITREDRLLQLSNAAFDGSVFDIFGSLLNGAALVLMKKEGGPDLDLLSNLIEQEKITVFFITTALFNALVDLNPDSIRYTRKILIGGEQMSVPHAAKALVRLGEARIINVYGPTETTVFATAFPVHRISGSQDSIPIGTPISNTTAYILDRYGNPVPLGICGELYIGGDGVARGYLNNPELTAERFIASPFTLHPSLLYKTGDLVRWLEDGNIEFLGRTDYQVKIRGFRVEPGEIEKQLLDHPLIAEAIVIVHAGTAEAGDHYLCAYVVPRQDIGPDIESLSGELKNDLSRLLPDYMIPRHFICLERMPLNRSGKVDRHALPRPVLPPVNPNGQSSTDVLTKRMIDIWAEVLGVENGAIGPDSDFFDLGGHSIKATFLLSRIHKRLQVKIPMREIFKTPTVRGLTEWMKTAGENRYAPIPVLEKKEYYDVSHSQKRVWILSQVQEASIAFNIHSAYDLEGDLELSLVEQSFLALVERHESLRTVFLVQGETLKQRVLAARYCGFRVEQVSLEETAPGLRQTQAKELSAAESTKPFDLARGPLLRVKLIHLDTKHYLLLFTMHHIIGDYLSYNVLLEEMLTLYTAFKNGKDNPLPRLRVHYKEYAAWHNRQLSGEHLANLKAYWLEQFDHVPPVLELPLDHQRPELQTYNGGIENWPIDETLLKKLKSFGEKHRTTLFMTLLSALSALFYQYTGQEDIILGTVTAGREHDDLRRQIGYYLNTLPLRIRFNKEDRFTDLSSRVKQVLTGAYDHQAYPFDLLVEELGMGSRRDVGRHPIFDVMVDMLNYNPFQSTVPNNGNSSPTEDIRVTPFEGGEGRSKFDLTIYIAEGPATATVTFEYNRDLFDAGTIQRMGERFMALLQRVMEAPDTSVSKLKPETLPAVPSIRPLARHKASL